MIHPMSLTSGIGRLFSYSLSLLFFLLGWIVLNFIECDSALFVGSYILLGLYWLTPFRKKWRRWMQTLVAIVSVLYVVLIAMMSIGFFIFVYKHLDASDYHDMVRLFKTELPQSFKIHKVRYFVIPAPDGPNPRFYEITMSAPDFSSLTRHIVLKPEVYSDLKLWLQGSAALSLSIFRNDLAERIGQAIHEGRQPTYLPPTYWVDTSEIQNTTKRYSASLTLDERTSPTLRLYIQSDAYFYLDGLGSP